MQSALLQVGVTEVLLVVVVLTLLGIGYGLVRLNQQITKLSEEDTEVTTDQLTAALGESFSNLEFNEKVGQIETHAQEMRDFHRDVTQMLQNPQQRGAFGETQLDVILSDHLPADKYGIRKQVVENKTPDAHIESPEGIICIDSKFPLDNYNKMLEADDESTQEGYQQAFAGDVEKQLEKIARDYVRPAAGTAEVAFAFIPSESVYYHLVQNEYDLLQEYSGKGVQVVSPLTLGQKLEIIETGIRSYQLSEKTEAILTDLNQLKDRFDSLDDEWGTLKKHIRHTKSKADEVDQKYEELETAFSRVESPSLNRSE